MIISRDVPKALKITAPAHASAICVNLLKCGQESDLQKEHFWVLGCRADNTVAYIELVTLGTLNNTLVHPREVYRQAIIESAAGIICVHNHPSGNLTPSDADITLTTQLKQAGDIIGIKLMDSIIISYNPPQYISMSDEGYV